MEAVPRLPMISFELKTSTEKASFSQPLKQYISQCYGEDPESYNNEIHNLESLRGGAVRPSTDVEGIQLLKKYYCQLHFLKSRFPMEELQPAAVYFSWKDNYSTMACSIPDIRFELMCTLYNIGALHSQLGAEDQRITPDGMKIACTHFQCAAWAFQVLRENYYQMVTYISAVEIVQFMELVCLAQAQECILEKSMMDNRKATIIAKVAVQVVDYFKRSQHILQGGVDENNYSDYVQVGVFKEWVKYLNFKVAYHKSISLLYQGQQAEEQQKMGERVALYQAAVDQLETAKKLSSGLENKQDISEALAFTSDFVEGKKKAAKNENDFIYHEEVPNKETFQEIKGASLVKGIPFNITDQEVSGQDIFARLIPMEAHEASSLYSERKAELLRKYGHLIENKDQKLAEFMSSMQIDFLHDMRQATGIPQDIVDRAAALSAKPNAIQDLISSMTKLSNSFHEVESLLNDIQDLLKEEGQLEKEYQKSIGERPPSIIATDLSREAAKYREAHGKANQSNQNLHRAMVTHVANLKTLSQPLMQLQQQIPSIKIPDPNVDELSLKEIEMLLAKVEEMKTQRGVLWAQLRDALHTDDITSVLVTKEANQSLDDVFTQQLDKHKHLTTLIEQNAAAQENIIKAFIDAYAKFSNTRRYLQSVITKRQTTITSLISSFDTYEDLLSKATKGIEFYTKLETNVTKLLQRIKSACKVQQEEREQMMAKVSPYKKPEPTTNESNAPKLKDYLDSIKKNPKTTTGQIYPSYTGGAPNASDGQVWPPGIRPAPVGSEINDVAANVDSYYVQNKNTYYSTTNQKYNPNNQEPSIPSQYGANMYQAQQNPNASMGSGVDQTLEKKMGGLNVNDSGASIAYQQYNVQDYNYYNYVPYGNTFLPASDVANSQANLKQPTDTYTQMPTLPQVPQYETGSSTGSISSTSAPRPIPYASQYSQYIPTHYQQVNQPVDNKINTLYGQSTSNHLYASGYATAQNYQNSNMATVQSGGYTSYGAGTLSQSEQLSSISSSGYGSNADVPKPDGAYNINQVSVPQSDGSYNTQAVPSGLSMNPSQNIPSNAPQSYQTNPMISGQSQPNYYPPGYESYQVGGTSAVSAGGAQQATPLMPYQPTSEQYGYGNYTQNTNLNDGSIQNYNVAKFQNETANSNNYSMQQQNFNPYGQSPTLSQYSEGYVGAGSLVFQNQMNPSSMYTQAGMSYVYNPKNSSSSSGGLTSPQCTQNPNEPNSVQNYYVTNQQQTDSKINSAVERNEESSTIDLLSGLDFSISQVPLEPEQKTIVPEIKKDKEISKPQTVASNSTPTEGCSEPKDHKTAVSNVAEHFYKVIKSKKLDNEEVKRLFQNEVDKYDKFVDMLSNKTLNGPTTLDLKWKEIQDNQELEGSKKNISVARCYPMKNRFSDILPYDHSRVTLKSTVDDYINASYIKDISPFVPPVIITQAPLQSTLVEFWTMLLEQRVEFIMCLLNDSEIDGMYWPSEKGKEINVGNMVISLQSIISKKYWTERIIVISVPEKREFSTVVQLQFTDWPGSLFPVSPDPFVGYIKEFIALYQQQQLHSNPMVIHCSSGIGRSGVACLLVFAILEVTNNAVTLPDLTSLTNKITSFRKNILRDREHLKFAYQAFLSYMKQVVYNNGNMPPSMNTKTEETFSLDSSTKNDPLSSLDPFWASRKDKK